MRSWFQNYTQIVFEINQNYINKSNVTKIIHIYQLGSFQHLSKSLSDNDPPTAGWFAYFQTNFLKRSNAAAIWLGNFALNRNIWVLPAARPQRGHDSETKTNFNIMLCNDFCS